MFSEDISLKEALKTTSFHLNRLKELGISSVKDFLLYFPRQYTDQREVRRIIDIKIGEINTVRGKISKITSAPMWRRKMAITTVEISDDSGSVKAVLFNQAYLAKTLLPNTEVIISGKAKLNPKIAGINIQNPIIERIKENQVHTARIVPIYHETELGTEKNVKGKISSKWIREKLFPLMPFADFFPEYLPEDIRKKYNLIPYCTAIRQVHFPANEKELEEGKHRLSFDELFLLQLAALNRKYKWQKIAGKYKKDVAPDWELMKTYAKSLPWPLTNAQKKAIFEILKDTEKPYPMSRLLEGDVGSGKTAVAAACVLQIVKGGLQTCLLAPTEILARQHLATLEKLLSPFEIKPSLLVGSTPDKNKKEIYSKLKNGEIAVVIGTHALIQEKVEFKNLGLAIIDEQHRFGVKQREKLKSHGSPHMLSLSATPIPRTLALIVYGDMDISILDELPAGRQKIITNLVPEEKRNGAYKWIEKEIEKGRQAFIIFPLIEESEVLEVKAATKEYEFLKKEIFPNIKIGLMHGQLESEDKENAMRKFLKGETKILVSTSVVEVGVDVPNATIMMIEGAERFGLSQLHQFRGRVGRGTEQSYCFLFPSSQNPAFYRRLNALVKYSSGFKLAQMDLQMRGPGEVYGVSQSGIPDLRMANLSDAATIKNSREAAEYVIEKDPELLNNKELKEKIDEQENVAIDY